jgi:hypothetical protein
MFSRNAIATVLLFLVGVNCFSQNIRNNIIADINTDPAGTNILDFMDFGGKTYFLIAGATEEVPAEYRNYKKIQLAYIDHATGQFSIIKEDRVMFPDNAIMGKFYKTSNNYFYFVISNYNPTDIWYSDGTSAGTQKKASYEQINEVFGVVKNNFYFSKVTDNDSNFEIRKIVANNAPVVVGTGQYMKDRFAFAGTDKIYFATSDESANVSIKALDSNGNIVVFRTLYDNTMYAIGEVNNKFVFSAAGTFATDGTVAGTTAISATNLGDCCNITPYRLKNNLYVSINGKLWATDGTPANTSDIANGNAINLLPFNIGNNLYYVKDNDLYTFKARETNNTTNTKLKESLNVKTFAVSPDSNAVYFGDNDGKLWQYMKNTSAFVKLNVNFETIDRMTFIGNDLFVLGSIINSNLDRQLYIYKNNTFSVYRFFNSNTQGALTDYVNVVDKYLIYKSARRTNEPILVVTQGLPENTIVIPDTLRSSANGNYIMQNDSIFYDFEYYGIREINIKARTYIAKKQYVTDDSPVKAVKINQHIVLIHRKELYEYNPSTNAHTLIKNFPQSMSFFDSSDCTVYNDRLYFFVYGNEANELWVTDGTTTGTKFLKAFPQDYSVGTGFYGYYQVNNMLVMSLVIEGKSYLWKTDGTVAGTALLAELKGDRDVEEYRGRSNIISDGKNLYFTFTVIENGKFAIHLYRTNNTLTGLEYLTRTDENDETFNICSCANSIYFMTAYPTQLWKYDIAVATLSKMGPESSLSFYDNPVCLGNTLWIPMAELNNEYTYFINVFDLTTGQSKRIMQPFFRTGSAPYSNSLIPFKNSVVYRRADFKYGYEIFIAGLCEDTNTRNSVSLTGSYYHTDAVTSTEKIALPTAINLFSAKNITLLPGFEAKNGSNFYANIKQCK